MSQYSTAHKHPITYRDYSNSTAILNRFATQERSRDSASQWPTDLCIEPWELMVRSGAYIFQEEEHSTEASFDGSIGITDIIADLKAGLGVPTKDIANILRISRQTLYSYQRGGDAQNAVNPATRRRAQELYQLVKQVRARLPKSPGPLSKNITNPQGQSLLDLLSDESLDSKAIKAMAGLLVERVPKLVADTRSNTRTLNELTPST